MKRFLLIAPLLITPIYSADAPQTLLDPELTITLEETATLFPQGPVSYLWNGTISPIDVRYDYDKRRLDVAYANALKAGTIDKDALDEIYSSDLQGLKQQVELDKNDPSKTSIQTTWRDWFSLPRFW